MLYGYGWAGVVLLAHRWLRPALRHLIIPVSYWRSIEYRLVFDNAAFQPSDRVLDIGSPKPLSLYLAKKLRADVYSTDIDEYFVNEYATLRYSERIPASRFHIGVEDGRLLSFPSDFFDRVYSISVIEHIPGTGDTECLREIARVLRSGGLCLLTVPFGTTSRDIYRPRKDFYWASSSTGAGDELVFFQRRYTEEDLSGLHVKRLQYIGERILARSPKEIYEVLSGIIQVLTGSDRL